MIGIHATIRRSKLPRKVSEKNRYFLRNAPDKWRKILQIVEKILGENENEREKTNNYEEIVEEKRKKFVRLAEARTVKAIKAIRVIGKLSNRMAYSYSDSDVTKIVKALQGEVEALKIRMKSSERPENVEFKL